jgi:hypothetical protein
LWVVVVVDVDPFGFVVVWVVVEVCVFCVVAVCPNATPLTANESKSAAKVFTTPPLIRELMNTMRREYPSAALWGTECRFTVQCLCPEWQLVDGSW